MLNQYTVAKGESLSYDGNGNLSNDGTNQYTYNAENRLIAATAGANTASYVYDSHNRRVSKTVNGSTTTFLYDGDQVIAEYDGSGTLLKKFLFGPGIDEPVFMEGVDNRYYYHANALGSVVALSNNTGSLAETYAYSSWGQVVSGSSVGNPYMYTGRRLDAETGLYYYRNRYYDANLRRFLQADPIGYTDGMNLYAYGGNSPWNYVDPWGLKDTKTVKRKSSATLRRMWEKAYGRPWPIDPVTGRNHDVSHKKALADGGTNEINHPRPKDVVLLLPPIGGLSACPQRRQAESFPNSFNQT